jgi:acyl-CoA reductase-like NAD-dependent aldehyde dehydrogenase
MDSLTFDRYPFLKELGLNQENLGCYRNGEWISNGGNTHVSVNPHDNKGIATTALASIEDYHSCISEMDKEKARWAKTPAPVRGEIVR